MYYVKVGNRGFNADHLVSWKESSNVETMTGGTMFMVSLYFINTIRLDFVNDEARAVIEWLHNNTALCGAFIETQTETVNE